MAKQRNAPLSGVRIVDLTALVMGPLATQTLADLGADVVKVEPPEGDALRRVGPSHSGMMGPLFLHLNRNKRSVVLDLKLKADHAKLVGLVGQADVLVHSVRPLAMARLGLSYDDLRKVNPGLIYAGLSGFGQRGPYAEYGAFDDMIQTVTGLAEMMGRTSDGQPRYVPANLVDRSVGLYAFGLIAAALYGREKNGGLGQEIGIAMYETFASLLLGDHLYGATFAPPLGPPGYPRLLLKDRAPYPTSDGYICCMIYTDRQWKDFLRIAGVSEAQLEPELAGLNARSRNPQTVFDTISAITRRHSSEYWLSTLRSAGLAAVPMRSLEDLVCDPHLDRVGQFAEVGQPSEGQLRLLRLPGEWEGWEPVIARPPPELGQHTDEVLGAAAPFPA